MTTRALKELSLAEKRQLAKEMLRRRAQGRSDNARREDAALPGYTEQTYDMFLASMSKRPEEMERFYEWVDTVKRDDAYRFELPRASHQQAEVDLGDQTCLNLSSYNYLGLGYHPEVIEAAKAALDRYGLGAASSPVISGTFQIHNELEQELVDFYGLPDRGVSLFSSGYGANVGTVSAFVKAGHHVVLDRSAHMSLLEGAQLSRATISYFRHNDPAHLDATLERIGARSTRTLVCTEGVFSGDGDLGKLGDIAAVCRKYGAHLLADEAHSVLVAGPSGRGVCESAGILDDVDLIIITFSKAFGGIGGALIARREITQYVNWYARCRMFSCAMGPAVTGGVLQSLRIATSSEGAERRARIHENAALLRGLLAGKVDIGTSESWIVPVMFGSEKRTLPLNRFLHRRGLDTSIMQFPAVNKNESRIRMFVTSEHTRAQIERAAAIVIEAAERFGFAQ